MSTSLLSRLRSGFAGSVEPLNESEALSSLQSMLQDLSPSAASWATDDCLLRFLRARNLRVADAHTQLMNAIQWRSSYGVDDLIARDSEKRSILRFEASTGKMFVLNERDRLGRAYIIMRPGLENSENTVDNLRYLVYTLERASHVAGDGKFTVVVDYFTGAFSARNAPSISTMRETLRILQNHYPERLGDAVLFEAPGFFYPLFKVIKPFIDPVTRTKIHFVKRQHVRNDEQYNQILDWSILPKEYGGNCDFQFDTDKYFDWFDRQLQAA